MEYSDLNTRERTILREIVSEYIRSARPVGSRTLSRISSHNLSPATIRNTMMDLEEMGYLTHPHTSAGRVPTDKAYRIYVDNLMDASDLSREYKQQIASLFHALNELKNSDEILSRLARIIGEVSSLLGIVLSPSFEEGIFDKLEFFPISSNKIMMVLAIKSGLVKTIMLSFDTQLTRDTLEKTARVLNQRLSNLTIGEIKKTLSKRLKDTPISGTAFMKVFIDQSNRIFDFSSRADIYLWGTEHLLALPEFNDRKKVLAFLGLLEEKEIIGNYLADYKNSIGVNVSIGEEHKLRTLQTLSCVTTSYACGNVSGIIGIMGPTRMRYPWLISLVHYTGYLTSEMLSHG